MKTGTVKFSKEFITPIGLREWVTLEWQVDEQFDETKAMDTFIKVKEFVCNSQSSIPVFPDNSMPSTPQAIINVERTSEDIRIAELIRDIYACTELEGSNGLKSYLKLAATCEEAKLAYEVMEKKIAKADKIINDTIKYGNA